MKLQAFGPLQKQPPEVFHYLFKISQNSQENAYGIRVLRIFVNFAKFLRTFFLHVTPPVATSAFTFFTECWLTAFELFVKDNKKVIVLFHRGT